MSAVAARMDVLDIEVRQEKQPYAAIPLQRERLFFVVEAHVDALPVIGGTRIAWQLDVDLEHAFEGLGALLVTRVDRDLSAAFRPQCPAGQHFVTGRNLADDLALRYDIRAMHIADPDLLGRRADHIDDV